MTRHQRIPGLSADGEALALAGLHAGWIIGGRQGAAPGLEAALEALPEAALGALIERFGLTISERDALIVAAAADLDPAAAAALAAHPLSVGGRATPALIDAVLPEAEPGLLAPSGLLRRAALLDPDPGPGLAHRPLSLAEPVLHFLRGAPDLDPALAPMLTPAARAGAPRDWTLRLARGLAAAHRRSPRPLLHLWAAEPESAARQAAGAFAALDMAAWRLDAAAAPAEPSAAAEAARRIDRDMALTAAGLIAVADPELDPRPLHRLMARVNAPALIVGGPVPGGARPVASLAAPEDSPSRAAAWADALGPAAEGREAEIAAVARQFHLSGPALGAAAETVALGLEDRLWPRARAEAGRALEGLAERIRPIARWEDLVLPSGPRRQLAEIAAFQRQRDRVNEDWGFRAKSARGLGLAALFSGPSGTGKTMAAEIVAQALGPETGEAEAGGLDLFRVDLSAIVSKYIGETEKNIARIFDAAERAGAVLIFDEGDALFGKRTSEVRDSLDRHANTETAYLLQRLEAYSGVAIVTTNLRDNVDEAFLRRFRFVVEFTFPDAPQREAIWQSVLPAEAPVGELDLKALARLSLTGGAIRSIALTAAFLAAEAGGPIGMEHMRAAARQEYAKLGKTFSESDLKGRRR